MDSRYIDSTKIDLDLFIKSNKIFELINALNIPENLDISENPSVTLGHSLGNTDFDVELSRRVKKVKNNSQTFGEYIEALYQKKSNEYPDLLKRMERIGISRQYKSKIINDERKPSKQKLLCMAIGFRLNLEETEKLLRKAEFSFTKELTVFDTVIGYFIEKGIYSTIKIDAYLEEFDQPTIFSIK